MTNDIAPPDPALPVQDAEPTARPATTAGFPTRLLDEEGAAFTLGDHLALAISHARITLREEPWQEPTGQGPMPTPITAPARRIDAA